MNAEADIIIVGSGPGATMAARNLVDAGKQVLMVDAGHRDTHYEALTPDKNFVDIRGKEHAQSQYFLGERYEAVPEPGISTGAQLAPSRMVMLRGVERWCPVQSSSFKPLESLGYGGLGAAWGLGAYVYSDSELQRCGLPPAAMMDAYRRVALQIGISADSGDFKSRVCPALENLQPPITPDNAIAGLLQRYEKKKQSLQNDGVFMGLPSMALLTRVLDGRQPNSYHDMDFYHNHGASNWRPAYMLDDLQKKANFRYLAGYYALAFAEDSGGVELISMHMGTKKKEKFRAATLLLGAGALGTARIVLRSLQLKSLPLLSNPYTYIPCLNPAMLGKNLSKEKTSMAQAMMIIDRYGHGEELLSLAFYTYRSLLLMRLVQQSPLNIRDNRILFKYLQSAFVVAGLHHPDAAYAGKKVRLVNDKNSPTGDALQVDYRLSAQQAKALKQGEKKALKALRALGLVPLKRINPGWGSSIHYGGTSPISHDYIKGYSQSDGLLLGSRAVYTVDGSSFAYLPAKGITLSIMANAVRVSDKIIENG